MTSKPPKPKKPLKTYLGKNQLRDMLAKEKLTIEDIAYRLHAAVETVRLYIKRYRL